MEEKKARLELLDSCRGFVILSMIAYHLCYDIFVIFKGNFAWQLSLPVFIWEQSICWSFNLISGFVWGFGKKNCIKRGVIINLCGLLVTFVTFLVMPQAPIIYGVLTFLGCAMILMLPISRLTDALPAPSVLACSFVLFLMTFAIPRGGIGIYTKVLIPLPESLYSYALLTPLGFPKRGFYSSDYFPLIPWIFLYICGNSLSRILLRNETFLGIAKKKNRFLSALGRHSLLIYMLHQPLCYLICMIIFGVS